MRRWTLFGALALVPWPAAGCVGPECATGDYTEPECRVVAENELARLRHPAGIEIEFLDPADTDAAWDARGLLAVQGDGRVRARVAGPGAFAIRVRRLADAPASLGIVLDNVDPDADIVLSQVGQNVVVEPAAAPDLRRELEVDLASTGTAWIRGNRVCPATHRIAVTADIQTNPAQFERIIERLAGDAEVAEALGEPLVALVIAGDISEASADNEFARIEQILRRAPVPVAVTPGNHDVFRTLHPNFNATFGPGNHSFEVCGTKFVLLDTGSGAIARSVEARLPDLLARDGADHLLLGMHHPPYAGNTAAGWSMEDRAQHLLVEAAIADADLIVAGHSHALHHFDRIRVGDTALEEVIVGTGGAYQGLGVPRYGYLRLTLSADDMQTCFVEVPPPGLAEPAGEGLSGRLPYCGD